MATNRAQKQNLNTWTPTRMFDEGFSLPQTPHKDPKKTFICLGVLSQKSQDACSQDADLSAWDDPDTSP